MEGNNMISKEELKEYAKATGLNLGQAEKDYFQNILLFIIYQAYSTGVIFKGGTALKKCFGLNRFSEDLDFLFIRHSRGAARELETVLNDLSKREEGLLLKEVYEKRQTLFGLLRITHSLLKHPIHIKIEISKKKNGVIKENRLLSSSVSPRTCIFPVATLASLMELKEKAIRGRNLPRDWFDYWYIHERMGLPAKNLPHPFPFKETLFRNELKRWIPQRDWKLIDTVIHDFQNA